MHEFSIVGSLIHSCYENSNGAKSIEKVTVKIGKLSGVEPHLLKVAFDTFKKNTICDCATLVIKTQDVILKCNRCFKQSTLKENMFVCKSCNSIDVEIVDGEDILLMSLEATK